MQVVECQMNRDYFPEWDLWPNNFRMARLSPGNGSPLSDYFAATPVLKKACPV